MDNQIKNNEPKPLYNCSCYVFISTIAIAWVLTYQLFSILNINSKVISMELDPFIILAIVCGYLGAIFVYSIGKIVSAKILGYKLISLNILGFSIIKNDKKYDCFFQWFEGIGFKFEYAPIKNQDKYRRYLRSGMFSSIIYEIILLSIFIVLNSIGNSKGSDYMVEVAYFILIMFLFPLFITTVSILPCLTDTPSDGFLLKRLKDEKAKEYYFANLINEYKMLSSQTDVELKEVLEEDYNPFVLANLKYQYFYYFDRKDLINLEKVSDLILSKEKYFIDDYALVLGYVGRIYCLVEQGFMDKASDYFWTLKGDVRKALTNKTNLDCVKIALIVAAFMDVSWEDYDSIKNKYKKYLSSYFYQYRIDIEEKEINKVISKVEEKYPDWKD